MEMIQLIMEKGIAMKKAIDDAKDLQRALNCLTIRHVKQQLQTKS
jgi:hypothetical protein